MHRPGAKRVERPYERNRRAWRDAESRRRRTAGPTSRPELRLARRFPAAPEAPAAAKIQADPPLPFHKVRRRGSQLV